MDFHATEANNSLTRGARRGTITAAPVCYKNVTSRLNAISRQIFIKYGHKTSRIDHILSDQILEIKDCSSETESNFMSLGK